MCLCCSVKAKCIRRDILPGYNLMKGMVDHPEWPKGHYALQRYNDPDYVFRPKPALEPKPKRSFNTEPKAFEKWKAWAAETDEMEKNFQSRPEIGYQLYKAMLKAGYRPRRDGSRWCFWLRNYLAKKLKTNK